MKIIIGKYEGTVYAEGNGYTGALELGTNGKGDRNRLKRKGRTKEIVKDKLKKAVGELEVGIETSDSFHGRGSRLRLARPRQQRTVLEDDKRL
jgi:hypothetical protein